MSQLISNPGFAHIARKIFSHLDNETAFKCREVCTDWKYFIEENLLFSSQELLRIRDHLKVQIPPQGVEQYHWPLLNWLPLMNEVLITGFDQDSGIVLARYWQHETSMKNNKGTPSIPLFAYESKDDTLRELLFRFRYGRSLIAFEFHCVCFNHNLIQGLPSFDLLYFFLTPEHGKDFVLYLGFIVFHRAIIRDNLAIVKFLCSYLDKQELASIQSLDGVSVLDAAMTLQKTPIVNFLLQVLTK